MCQKKWGLTDNKMCVCGNIQKMSNIVDSCPTDQIGRQSILQRLHTADEAAVDWLTSYGT